MKKLSFALCVITIVFIFIGCGKTYDNTTKLNTQEDNKYYYENLKQLVMVNDELYYNTERENTIPMKCGTMDGEIISMVNQYDIPNANKIGVQDGQIELNIDNKWMIFEKLYE